MRANNFKELEIEQASRFDAQRSDRVKKDVHNSMSIFRFIGDIIELYIPRVLGIFTSMSGGDAPDKIQDNVRQRPKYPNSPD